MRTQHHRLSRYRRISPRAVKIGLLITGLILLVDILAARFSAGIQAALTLPAAHLRLAASTRVAPPTQLPAVTPTSSLTLPVKSILAQDTFQRANHVLWGIASDGQAWGADAKSSQGFAIVNHTGHVTNSSGVFDAILGPRTANAEIVFSGSLTHYASSSLGAVLRWTDANNLYKVFLGGGQLILLKKVAGVVTVLKTVPFLVQDGMLYTFRFRVIGSLLLGRVWPAAQVEPSTWMLMVTDTDLLSGYGGLRIVIQSGTTAVITSFMESSL